MANPILPTPDAGPAQNIRPTEGASDYLARGILGLGSTALEVDKQLAVARLERDITSATQAFATVEQKAAGVDNILVDKDYRTLSGVRMNPEQNENYFKELETHTNKLRGLKNAQAQGALSSLAFRTRVEQITRDAISRRPGLRSELASAAASTLGFDPLGQGLRELLSTQKDTEQLTAFQKGQQETEKEVGALFQAMRAVTPSHVPDDEVEQRARDTVAMDKQATAVTKLMEFSKGQAAFTESVVDSITATVSGSMQVALFKSFSTAAVNDFENPEKFNADLKGLLDNQVEGINQLHAQFKAMPAYNDPFSRAIVEKKIEAMKKDANDTFMLMAREFDNAKGRGEVSTSAELAKLRLESILWLKARIEPNYPGFWNSLAANNFNMLSSAVPSGMRLGSDVMSALDSLSTGKLALPPAKPAGGGTAAPKKASTFVNPENSPYIKAAQAPKNGPDTNESAFDRARGDGLLVGNVIAAIASQKETMRPEQANEIKSRVGNVYSALTRGAGDSTDGDGRPVQFRKVVVGKQHRYTNAEYGAREVVKAVVDNPAVVTKMDEDTNTAITNVAVSGYSAYLNQLVAKENGLRSRLVQDAVDKGGPVQSFVKLKLIDGPAGPTVMAEYKDNSFSSRGVAQSSFAAAEAAAAELTVYARAIVNLQPSAKEQVINQLRQVEALWGRDV